jgi:hypothetical protein
VISRVASPLPPPAFIAVAVADAAAIAPPRPPPGGEVPPHGEVIPPLHVDHARVAHAHGTLVLLPVEGEDCPRRGTLIAEAPPPSTCQ